jgi:hypothetical protein
MPSAKSGTAGSPVSPADPLAANDADDADPGALEQVKAYQRETQTGKYGTVQTKPFQKDPESDNSSNDPSAPPKTSWIEIVLVDEENNPVPGEPYSITLPDNTVASGTLDEKGFARVEGFQSGNCQISFPQLDQDAWVPK